MGGDVSSAALLTSRSRDVAARIDHAFDLLLPVPDDARARLYKAMRHAAIGGGKRLRPLLVEATCDLFNIARESALRVGLAVECIHVYSLIHDDLPAMDDDDMRRGKPTVHILADEQTHADPFVRIDLVRALALASGPAGMAGGQMMDLEAEKSRFDLATVTRLQNLKTGALIAFCVEAAAIMARIPVDARTSLHGYARDIGLAFQIADDLLDVEGDADLAGKALGKDAAAGKETFVSLLGVDRARAQAHMLVDQAKAHLHGYGAEADLLRAIADYIIERDR
jgi:farnesyl diphosphate synthase